MKHGSFKIDWKRVCECVVYVFFPLRDPNSFSFATSPKLDRDDFVKITKVMLFICKILFVFGFSVIWVKAIWLKLCFVWMWKTTQREKKEDINLNLNMCVLLSWKKLFLNWLSSLSKCLTNVRKVSHIWKKKLKRI